MHRRNPCHTRYPSIASQYATTYRCRPRAMVARAASNREPFQNHRIPGRPVEFCRSLQLNRLAPSDPEGFRTRLESPSLGWPNVLSSLLVASPPGVRVHNFFVWGKGFAEDCRSTISPEERHVLPLRLSACPHPGLGPRRETPRIDISMRSCSRS